MKKLSRINLHNLSQAELAKREEKLLIGGGNVLCACAGSASCGCLYEGPKTDNNDAYYGGSSSNDNFDANFNLRVTDNVTAKNNP